MQVVVRDNNVDQALKVLKKKMQREGIFREMKLRKDPACPLCGDEPTIKELIDYEGFCGI